MQLDLGFLKTPRPGSNVWTALDDEQRIVVLDVLARKTAGGDGATPTSGGGRR